MSHICEAENIEKTPDHIWGNIKTSNSSIVDMIHKVSFFLKLESMYLKIIISLAFPATA